MQCYSQILCLSITSLDLYMSQLRLFSTCTTNKMWLWVSESMNGCGNHSFCHRWLNLSLVCLPNSVPCKRCVVVGNGGVLKNKTLGGRIDSYDVIIR